MRLVLNQKSELRLHPRTLEQRSSGWNEALIYRVHHKPQILQCCRSQQEFPIGPEYYSGHPATPFDEKSCPIRRVVHLLTICDIEGNDLSRGQSQFPKERRRHH